MKRIFTTVQDLQYLIRPALSMGLLLSILSHPIRGQESSAIVYEDENTCLRYVADVENNYIPDFSYAGYKNGEEVIPEVATIRTLSPIEGDNTAHIQAVLDEMAELPPDAQGIRGALLLEAGSYEVHGTIVIRGSGIVLRGVGAGSDADSNTVILGVGNIPNQRDIIQVGNNPSVSWSRSIAGTHSTLTSTFIPSGSRSLQVTAPELYSVGSNIIIRQRSTSRWLSSI
nr:hypothetical protein [Saprospiraceae bacterium]